MMNLTIYHYHNIFACRIPSFASIVENKEMQISRHKDQCDMLMSLSMSLSLSLSL